MPREWMRKFGAGVRLGQIVRPLDTVAAYIPAGRYPLPSTMMMTAVPAQVAGVREHLRGLARSRSTKSSERRRMLGVDQVFEMGGAQAIAAFAFGTRPCPSADRIVGPGNIYVAAAKKLLAGEVGIDFVAGPTEILIIAADGDPRFLAADMLAQAEHDVDASAILLTTSKRLAAAVAKEVERQLATLPTAPRGAQGHRRNSRHRAGAVARGGGGAFQPLRARAPEHSGCESCCPQIRHAGSIFIGPFSPEAAGDYASGPNHVLPTSGAARLRGGLSVADFVKVISVQQLNAAASRETGAGDHHAGARRRAWKPTRDRWRCGPMLPVQTAQAAARAMPSRGPAVLAMAPYSPPTGGRAGKLRLDFNENTVGCSPRVIEALRERLDASALTVYPEYGEVKRGHRRDISACSRSNSCSPTAPTKPSRCSSTRTSTMARKC